MFEILEKLVDRGEGVGLFGAADVTMVAFARLIVIPQDADPVRDEGETVLVALQATGQYSWQAPQDHLGKQPIGQDQSAPEKQLRLHL